MACVSGGCDSVCPQHPTARLYLMSTVVGRHLQQPFGGTSASGPRRHALNERLHKMFNNYFFSQVGLLHALAALREIRSFTLHVLHFNHRIRARERLPQPRRVRSSVALHVGVCVS